MSQHINVKNETRRFLTKKGARAFVPGSDASDVIELKMEADQESTERGNIPSVESHRHAYGRRHGRGDDWAAENAREHQRIVSGKLLPADEKTLEDGALRSGVTVEAFTAAILKSDPHQTLPTEYEGTRPAADQLVPVADAPKPRAKGRK